MRRWLWIAACVAMAACAGRSSEPVAEPAAPRPAPARGASSAASVTPPTPAAVPVDADAGSRPIPPLSSPNPRPGPTAAPDAQAPPAAPEDSPRQAALRRAGEAAQSCYAKSGLPAGASGKLHVRLTLAADGKVARAEVDRAKSSAKLIGGTLEKCVLAAVAAETFPAPRSGTEVQLEIPIELRAP